MAMDLHPCSGCGRHVKSGEALCPFCGAHVSQGAPLPAAAPSPPGRLSRAALLGFGVGAIGAVVTLTDCGSSVALYGAPASGPTGSGGGGGGTGGAGGSGGGADGG